MHAHSGGATSLRAEPEPVFCIQPMQSCPWVGLTRGLGWVGSGMGRFFFVFSGLGWVMGLKWQMCENTCRVYM